MYYNDYETEPIGGDNPYYRCVHCHRSVPEINGRIEGHLDYCFYRRCREANYDYGLAFLKYGRPEEEGPTSEDGSYEEGFRGPRPWNGYGGSDEGNTDTIQFVGSTLGKQ